MEVSSFLGIREIGQKDFATDPLTQRRVLQPKDDFDTLIKITGHPVRAAQVDLPLAAIRKCEDAAVFEESADDTADTDTVTDVFHPRTQGTSPPNNQFNGNAGLRGPVQRVNDILIEKRVHLGNNERWA